MRFQFLVAFLIPMSGLANVPLMQEWYARGSVQGVTWVGSSNTVWTNSANWSPARVPTSTDNVIIDGSAYTNQPLLNLTGTITIASLTIGQTASSTLTLSNGNVTTKKLVVSGNTIIGPNGTMTHPRGTAHAINLYVGGNLTISSGGEIDVDNKGASTAGAPGSRAGAGHGGEGGWSTVGIQGTTYDSVTNPVLQGSSATKGYGGGLILLQVAGTFTHSGSITALGYPRVHDGASGGSGSGGSINMTVGSIVSTGIIGVDGGNGDAETAYDQGGGGGRVAVWLTGLGADFSNTIVTNITAYGGTDGGGYGGAGTVYLRTLAQNRGDLIVNNRNQADNAWIGATLFRDSSYTFDTITITNYGRMKVGTNAALDLTSCPLLTPTSTTNSITSRLMLTNFSAVSWTGVWTNDGCISWCGSNTVLTCTGSLVVASNAFLTHESGWGAINLNLVGDLTITNNGAIWLKGRSTQYTGQGALRAGGGHGGEGGRGYTGTSRSTTYDSITNPVLGGCAGSYTPGLGGGAIIARISGLVNVDGVINADGSLGGSGGAGGTVNIVAGAIEGDARISVNGGSANNNGGGGGGGRIALIVTNSASFGSLIVTASGGTLHNGENGGAGTIYLKTTNDAYGLLIVSNNQTFATSATTFIGPLVTDANVGDVRLLNTAKMMLTNDALLTVNGSWSNAAPTNALSGGTVAFAGTNPASIFGGNTWSNLLIAEAGKTVSFQSGKTQMVYGVPAFTNVTIKSISDGSWWYLLKPGSGTQDVGVVTVQDSNATNGWTIQAASGSTNNGNNVNWTFLP